MTQPAAPRRQIVVATTDALGAKMAGPAIRAHHFAAALADAHDVQLVTTAACAMDDDPRFRIRAVSDVEVAELARQTDVWVIQGNVLLRHPVIAESDAAIVVDLYDPYHLEGLEHSRSEPMDDRLALVHNAAVALNRSIIRGDYFLVASDKQRDFWLGALAALGRINPLNYDADPRFASMFGTVPFGVDDDPPVHVKPVLRGVVPGIGDDDVVLIWGGGIYNWFDPQTLVRAVHRLTSRRADLRLFFLGAAHPTVTAPGRRTAAETRILSDELGLTGRHVFFNDGWVPYADRASYLLEADIGVSTHRDQLETEFSFRTRLLDYLWAGLPIVATGGDVFAPVIRDRGLGAVVPPGDDLALAEALAGLIDDPTRRGDCARASKDAARDYAWTRALTPVVEFCAKPRPAPDLANPRVRGHLERPLAVVRAPTPGRPGGWRGEIALGREYWEQGGAGLLGRRIATRAGKLLRGHTD